MDQNIRFYEFVLNNVDDPLLLYENEKFIFINKSFKDTFNVTEENVIGTKQLPFVNNEHNEKLFNTIKNLLSRPNDAEVDLELNLWYNKISVVANVKISKFDTQRVLCKFKHKSKLENFFNVSTELEWLKVLVHFSVSTSNQI